MKKALLLAIPLAFGACDHGPTAPRAHETDAPSLVASAAAVRTTWPSADDPGPPFYARIEPTTMPGLIIADGWAVILFYRDPGCIPPEFNLLSFFDIPRAFGCTPLVEGFNVWREAVLAGPPMVANSRAAGPVTFWFVPAQTALAAVADGELTIGELAGLAGRISGSATQLQEVLHPIGGHPAPMLSIRADGLLEDGRRFQFQYTHAGGEVRNARLSFR